MSQVFCIAKNKLKRSPILFVAIGFALCLHSSPAHAAVEISDGSVKVLYHFDNNLTDSSGNGVTLNNASTSFANACAGNLSKEVQFGSSTSFVSAPTSSSSYFSLPDPTASGTIGFWWDIGATGFQILAGLDTGGGSHTKWNVYYDSGLMHLEGYNSGLSHFDLNFSYTPTVGHCDFIVFKWNNSHYTAYVNGTAQTTLTGSTLAVSASQALQIGQNEQTGQTSGGVDEFFKIDKELPTSTITSLYASGTGNPICTTVGCATPVEISDNSVKGLWHLASDFTDSSGFGQNGTSTGSPSFSTSSAPNYSGSISLNGSNQYVDVAGTSSASWNLNLANGSVTLGAWAYLNTGIQDYAAILGSDNGSGAQKKYVVYYSSSTNTLAFDWYDDSVAEHTYSVSWSPAIPSRHFIVLRATGGGTTKHYQFYVDGQPQGAEYTSTDSGANPNHSLDIGYAETGVIWKGNINEAFFSRSALTTSTIQAIYNNGDGALICTTVGCGS